MSAQPTPATGEAPAAWWRFGRWPTAARVATYLLVAVLVGALLVSLLVAWAVRRPLPQTEGEISVPGLEGEVEVVRDSSGIPRIYADTVDDLMFAQGFVHAQERFFEMDMRRRYTAGRLSEVFGTATLETDKLVRTLGWREVAEREFALASPEAREALQHYADGVNAWLEGRHPTEIAAEYTALTVAGAAGYEPQRWQPVDSLSWLKAMAWDLQGNLSEEVARSLTSVNHTPAQVEALFPPYDEERFAPIVTAGELVGDQWLREPGVSRQPDAAPPGHREPLARVADGLAAMPQLLGAGDGIGSNSWVLSGDRTEDGAPILANDPHLAVSVPGVWMQVGLHCRRVSEECPYDVAGFSFSGVPGVVIGHNADIAWGLTNLGPDVADLYLERLDRGRARYGGRWRELDSRTEVIAVADSSDVRHEVRSTRHGPLLSDVDNDLTSVGANAAAADGRDAYGVSLAWTGLIPGSTFDALLALNAAGNWREFRAAARLFDVPAQNLLYADRAGRIGYQTPGQIPIRKAGHDGRQPVPGWRRAYAWTGRFVPFESLPNLLDPAGGAIVAANQAPVASSYPYLLGTDFDHGYRSGRIADLLAERETWSVEELADLQLDDLNPMAPTLVPRLLDVEILGARYYRDGQELLETWDYRQQPDSAAAAYFNAVWANLLRLTFHDEIRRSLWPEGGQRWYAVVERLLDQPRNAWWDDRTTDEVETRDDILLRAMVDARDDLTRFQAFEPDSWQWGLDHRIDLRHRTFGGIRGLAWLFNLDGGGVGGGNATVNATEWDASVSGSDAFAVTSGPTMRMVVSLGDLDASRWVALTGVSGHPASRHYDDQLELWARGETLTWPFTRESVDADGAANGSESLTLVPAD